MDARPLVTPFEAKNPLALDLSQIETMQADVEEQIAAEQEDPTTQQYFMRLDTKTVIKTEAEYFQVQAKGIRTKVVGYPYAMALLANEEAKLRAKQARRRANKVARAARKRNR